MKNNSWSRVISLGIVWLLFGLPSALFANDSQPFPPQWQKLLDAHTQQNAKPYTPGILMLFEDPSWGTRIGLSGVSNMSTKQPLTSDMRFRIGSVSKLFTAVVILQLEQEGKLRLTDNISKYLTDGSVVHYGDQTTIASCLNHTSGIPDFFEAEMYQYYPFSPLNPAYNAQYSVAIDLLIAQSNGATRDFDPDARFANVYKIYQQFRETPNDPPTSEDVLAVPQVKYRPTSPMYQYVNINYVVLGLIIESVTGKTLQQAIKERIIDKLGLTSTSFATANEIPTKMVRSYSQYGPNQQVDLGQWYDRTEINVSYAWGSGMMISDLKDLQTFAHALFLNNELISDGTRSRWMMMVSGMSPGLFQATNGLMRFETPFGTGIGHEGIIPAFKTAFIYMPSSKGLYITISSTYDNDDFVPGEIMHVVLGAAHTPTPSNDATNVQGPSTQLRWQPGQVYADKYNIYLGTNPDAMSLVGSSNTLSYTTSNLRANTTYYWRVEHVKNDISYSSATWQFTTQ